MIARDRADEGSASVWVIACSALLLLAATTIAIRTSATLARHRAEFAADAAALAVAGQIGVGGQPCAAAEPIAAANGATVHECVLDPTSTGRSGQVTVTVALAVRLPILGRSSVQARARAEREPP